MKKKVLKSVYGLALIFTFSDILSAPAYSCMDLRPSQNLITAKRTVFASEPEDSFAVCHYCKKGILLTRHKNTLCNVICYLLFVNGYK